MRRKGLARPRKLRYAPFMIIASSLLLLASAQVLVAEPVPSEIHNFADWIVTCDNVVRCQATSLVPEPTAEEQAAASQAVGTPAEATRQDPWERFGSMNLEREAGGNAPLAITLGDFEGTPARLVVNDAQLPARLTRTDLGEWVVEPADRNSFFDALYSGTLVVQDASGRTLSEFALGGLWASLVYMDERQGRLRTPTALIRRGRRPVSVVPASVSLPVVRAAPRTSERALAIPARRMAEARRETGCTEEEVGAVASDEAPTEALGNGRTLIMMGCGAGAYNYNAIPLIAWREGNAIRIEPARFDVSREQIEGEPDPTGYSVTNAEFDAATLTISEYAKGRGIGDCGVAARYAWDGQMFRLTERREMSECRGSREMLTTWRAEVR